MTKTEFLQQLYNHLLPLSQNERDDIVSDFEEHFAVGLESGKTEEQICAELGNPYSCALQYLRQAPPSGANVQAAPVPTVKRTQDANAGNTASRGVYGAPKGNPQRNRVLWSILFFCAVAVSFGVYPTALGLMCACIAVLVVSVVATTLTAPFTVFGFMLSLGLFLFALGLLMFLVMTWFLKLSWRRADL